VDRQAAGAPRIGVVRSLWAEASAAMQNAVESAAAAAERAGAQVVAATLPPIVEEAWRIHPTIQDYEAWRALAFEYDHHRDAIPAVTRELLDAAAAITADAYHAPRPTTRRAPRGGGGGPCAPPGGAPRFFCGRFGRRAGRRGPSAPRVRPL